MRKILLIAAIPAAVIALTAAYLFALKIYATFEFNTADIRNSGNLVAREYRRRTVIIKSAYVIDTSAYTLRLSTPFDFVDSLNFLFKMNGLDGYGRPKLSEAICSTYTGSDTLDWRRALIFEHYHYSTSIDTAYYSPRENGCEIWLFTRRGLFHDRYAGDSLLNDAWIKKSFADSLKRGNRL